MTPELNPSTIAGLTALAKTTTSPTHEIQFTYIGLLELILAIELETKTQLGLGTNANWPTFVGIVLRTRGAGAVRALADAANIAVATGFPS